MKLSSKLRNKKVLLPVAAVVLALRIATAGPMPPNNNDIVLTNPRAAKYHSSFGGSLVGLDIYADSLFNRTRGESSDSLGGYVTLHWHQNDVNRTGEQARDEFTEMLHAHRGERLVILGAKPYGLEHELYPTLNFKGPVFRIDDPDSSDISFQ